MDDSLFFLILLLFPLTFQMLPPVPSLYLSCISLYSHPLPFPLLQSFLFLLFPSPIIHVFAFVSSCSSFFCPSPFYIFTFCAFNILTLINFLQYDRTVSKSKQYCHVRFICLKIVCNSEDFSFNSDVVQKQQATQFK